MEADAELTRTLEAMPADAGHRIRVALAYLKRSQSDLARGIGADVTKISRAINGYRGLTPTEREQVASFLGVAESLLFPTSEAVNQ